MTHVVLKILFFLLNICFVQFGGAASPRSDYKNHRALSLNNQQVIKLAQLSNVSHFNAVLDSILVPRVVGTPQHEKVKDFLVSSMSDMGWTVEKDVFQDNAPGFGKLTFTNVIATVNPNAKRYLVLACHYDSKYFRDFTFLAATDSAVPCAMMINLAYTMKDQIKSIAQQTNLSLKFIFFDGEEAFENWGPRDSIYGARHLANKWSKTKSPEGYSYLEKMDVLMLLDLLGTADPHFYSFFSDTEPWYRMLVDAEVKLSSFQQSTKYSVSSSRQRYFQPMSSNSLVEDDHIPFQRLKVPILHVIPLPFPLEWHTAADNRNAVDMKTVENLNMIFRVFVAEYLGISV